MYLNVHLSYKIAKEQLWKYIYLVYRGIFTKEAKIDLEFVSIFLQNKQS